MKQLKFKFDTTRKIMNRNYSIVNMQVQDIPRQASVCLCMLLQACEDSGTCTEAKLREVVQARAQELKTKQDPWRIFQYYRPQLVKLGFIAHN